MSNQDTTDEQIALGVLDAPDLFGVLIDRYQAKLERYIARLSDISHDEKEEVLQEVFVKAYENIASFNANMSFNSWIYRICHNVTINYWKKNKRYSQGTSFDSDEGAFLENMMGENTVEQELFAQSDREEVTKALGKLKQHYKDILVLRFFEEKSYDEISDILKMPPGTVATHISRAKAQLAKHISSNV